MRWAQLRSYLRRTAAGRRAEQDLDEEVRAYVELLADEKAARGMGAEDARRAAAVETGGVEQVKEAVRGARFGAWLDDAVQDVRYGARLLARSPGFSIAAAGALALGIGAATVIFGAVDAVLLRPLPYAEPDRLVVALHYGHGPVAPATYAAIRSQATSFDAVGVAEYWRPNLAGDGPAESVRGLRLTAATLEMIGARPVLGRLFTAEEEETGRERVLLLGHGLWQRRFGGDPGVLGRAVRLDGTAYTVTGVMPAGFDFPPFWARGAEMWAPLPLRDRIESRDGRSLRLFARLAPGVRVERAREEVAALVARGEAEHPGSMKALVVRPLMDVVVRNVRPALLVMLGAVGLLLLIACANVAHMLLARAAGRAREIAVRHALGADRGRVVRQLLAESVLLSLLGAAGGIGLAFAGTRALVAWRPASVPRIETMAVDLRLLAVAVAAAVACGLAFGLAPALYASRRDVQGALREGERGSTEGAGRRRLRSALVASEVALALVLLAGAGLLVRTFVALHSIDPGFDPKGVLSMVVSVAGSQESAAGRRAEFFQEAVRRLRALPGVTGASAINHLPVAGDIWGRSYHVAGRPIPAPGEAPNAAYRVVLPGYFHAMRLPLVRGRDFADGDARGRPGVVIVNEALAEKQWPGQDPVGRAMTLDDPRADDPEWLTVVGVAKNAVRRDWSEAPSAEVYLPFLQRSTYLEEERGPYQYLTLVVRTAGDATALAPEAQGVVRSLAADAAVSQVQTMEAVVAEAMSEPRLYVVLLVSFATVALALAALGIYAVASYGVARRRREIAIRIALGARAWDVLSLVLGQGMRTVAVGAGAGLLGALALGPTLSSLLYGVEPADPLTLAGVVLALAAVALVAIVLPARRAVAVRGLEALGSE
jgi:putative ABC transport system permease protein